MTANGPQPQNPSSRTTSSKLDIQVEAAKERRKTSKKAELELQALLSERDAIEAQEFKLLPLFPEMSSAMPHKWTRTSLFCSTMRGGRPTHKQIKLTSRSDFHIEYTGEQLDMADNDVFLNVLKMAENHDANDAIYFVRSNFLTQINRSAGTSGYNWLESSLRRLAEATLFIEDSTGKGGVVRLLKDMRWDRATEEYWIKLDPKIVDFFEISQIAFINLESRKSYKHPLSKWLQNYVSSHKANEWHYISIELIMSWAGVQGRQRDFANSTTRGLPKALKELELGGDISNEWSIYTKNKGGFPILYVKWFRIGKNTEKSKAKLEIFNPDIDN